MKIHSAVSEIRFRAFKRDVDVLKGVSEMKEPYDKFFVANINDIGVARIEGLSFRLTKSMMRDIAKELIKNGAIIAEWRHKDKNISINLREKFNA